MSLIEKHPTDEDLSAGTPTNHPTDEDLSAGTPTTASAETQARGFWASVREALRGTHQDYTIGSLNRSIFLLAIPMVLEMVLVVVCCC